ncbi:MAG: hypothetical protein O3C52_03065 [Proteobacteria bacterium]|nr:hypothetical protein [Pseudomonadota bacterium]MDA1032342.1 hypothetical protein [Pseudomonadota bacterium]
MGRRVGDHLLLADRKGTSYIDCSDVPLPFGSQLVSDVMERTEIARNQDHALLSAELVLTAQANARKLVNGPRPKLKSDKVRSLINTVHQRRCGAD